MHITKKSTNSYRLHLITMLLPSQKCIQILKALSFYTKYRLWNLRVAITFCTTFIHCRIPLQYCVIQKHSLRKNQQRVIKQLSWKVILSCKKCNINTLYRYFQIFISYRNIEKISQSIIANTPMFVGRNILATSFLVLIIPVSDDDIIRNFLTKFPCNHCCHNKTFIQFVLYFTSQFKKC